MIRLIGMIVKSKLMAESGIFCTSCGVSLRATAMFCGNCGTKKEAPSEISRNIQKKEMDVRDEKVEQALDIIQKLKEAEIGNQTKLNSIKKVLEGGSPLSRKDDSYLAIKFKQLRKIDERVAYGLVNEDRITKGPRPVNPDAKYCAYCQRMVTPERDFSVGALIILLLIGIIPGIIYYFLKAKTCPICKHHQWQIPPDEE